MESVQDKHRQLALHFMASQYCKISAPCIVPISNIRTMKRFEFTIDFFISVGTCWVSQRLKFDAWNFRGKFLLEGLYFVLYLSRCISILNASSKSLEFLLPFFETSDLLFSVSSRDITLLLRMLVTLIGLPMFDSNDDTLTFNPAEFLS